MLPEDLLNLLSRVEESGSCKCDFELYRSWKDLNSVDVKTFELVGSLADGDYVKVSSAKAFSGNYWDQDHPIALKYYPQIESTIYRCRICKRLFLFYTEVSGHGGFRILANIR